MTDLKYIFCIGAGYVGGPTDFGYAPNTSIDEDLKRFVQWYLKSEVK